MILIACALAAELRGWLQRPGTQLLETGVGPVEAGIVTARTLAEKPYSAVLSAGIGGAFPGRGHVGEALVVAEERLADLGREDGERLALPDGAVPLDRAFSSDELLARIDRLPYRIGTGITVHRVTCSETTVTRLLDAYHADVESMEGYAVLRASRCAGVPALEIRGISNYVGPRTASQWNFAAGAQACVAALDAVLDRLGVA